MSHYPANDFDRSATQRTGLATTALVLGIAGLVVPLLGLVGLILGIMAMSRAKRDPQTYGGSGLGLAAVITGACGTLMLCIILGLGGLLLPALGAARQTARAAVTSAHLQQIGMGLMSYAADNRDTLPEDGADWQARLSSYNIPAGTFISVRGDPAATAADSFVYVPGYQLPDVKLPHATVLVYENPKYVDRGMVAVLFADGHVQLVPSSKLQQVLDASEKPKPAATVKPKSGR